MPQIGANITGKPVTNQLKSVFGFPATSNSAGTSNHNFSISPELGANQKKSIAQKQMISAQIKFNIANHSTIKAVGPDLTADKIAFSFGAPVWGSHKLNADLQFKYILLEGERRKSAQRHSFASLTSDGPAGLPRPNPELKAREVPIWHPEPMLCFSLHKVVRAIPEAHYWQSRRWNCYREVYGVLPVDSLDRHLAVAATDRHKSVQASLFADPFLDCFQSWVVVLRSIRAYPVGRRSLTAVRHLDNRRTKALSYLWRAEHPAALPLHPPPPCSSGTTPTSLTSV